MAVLGVDTSNYATSLAVVSNSGQEVVCAKKRMLPIKPGQLGLRQSDAVFQHTLALPLIADEMREAFKDVTAVGVSEKPRDVQGSYMPCFMAGVSFATSFSAALGVPLVKTSHQQGHVAAAMLGVGDEELFLRRALVFHVSGGTTDLLLCEGYRVQQTLGTSLDLYAGQAVDRLGGLIGFSFPSGQALSALAETCSESPAPKISVEGMNCHFSGLQNQCEGLLAKGQTPAYVAKYCLLVIAKTAAAMVVAARKQHKGLPLVCAGGVMCSTVVRAYLTKEVADVVFAPAELSADNAVGVAVIAAREANDGTYYRGIRAK